MGNPIDLLNSIIFLEFMSIIPPAGPSGLALRGGLHGYIWSVWGDSQNPTGHSRILPVAGLRRGSFRSYGILGGLRENRFTAEISKNKRGRVLIERLVVIAAFG